MDDSLALAAAGDKSAFAAIVREYQSMVYSVGLHYLRNAALAEEIAQDVFLDLYRNLRSVESGAHLVWWLRRVTVNRCIDRGRKRAWRAEVALEKVAEPASARVEQDPMASDALRRLVAALPEHQRAIVILRFQEDLDPTEIARVLEMPVNTVKSRLHRALGMLREKLERKQKQEARA
ncbi:MAG TPA: sigma-70 family RNA polymerase sigma factor [Bryobacteraceae bacterium]|jgi:RNA polymerase sigma-70 factor (ECF subfamily)|nr:sigma-70 family RNA polymerase sigma factor [Bryobacteraceae bacterium]